MPEPFKPFTETELAHHRSTLATETVARFVATVDALRAENEALKRDKEMWENAWKQSSAGEIKLLDTIGKMAAENEALKANYESLVSFSAKQAATLLELTKRDEALRKRAEEAEKWIEWYKKAYRGEP